MHISKIINTPLSWCMRRSCLLVKWNVKRFISSRSMKYEYIKYIVMLLFWEPIGQVSDTMQNRWYLKEDFGSNTILDDKKYACKLNINRYLSVLITTLNKWAFFTIWKQKWIIYITKYNLKFLIRLCK